jgi:hypothetical protein
MSYMFRPVQDIYHPDDDLVEVETCRREMIIYYLLCNLLY